VFRRSPQQKLPRYLRQILKPYFPGFDPGRVVVREGIPWYVLMDADGYTDRCTIYFKPGKYDPGSVEGIALIGHELAHCWQYHRHGTWGFRIRYLSSWLWHLLRTQSWTEAYLNISFEIEAREIEGLIYRDLLRCLPGSFPPC